MIVSVIDIRYWWYQADGSAYAPKGGQNLSPRQHARVLHPKSSSAEQVARGKKSYQKECADCHGEKLEGIDKAPALTGEIFSKNWNGKSVFKLIDVTRRTMPPAS